MWPIPIWPSELKRAIRSQAGLKKSLYDSYKLALRWASDRIGDEGVIAFVTNGSFIDGNADAGLRACLADEFSHLYVFKLRGNQRTQGERSRQEGGKIFGSGSRTPVAIIVLVRDPAHQGACQIFCKDSRDYLSREKKLQVVKDFGSIAGISDWQRILPDEHHDWLDQRDPAYQRFIPLGIKSQKLQADVSAKFSLLSLGIATNRDSWVYSFDREQLNQRMKDMTIFYQERLYGVSDGTMTDVEATANDSPDRIKWTRGLRGTLGRRLSVYYDPQNVRFSMYRPFVKQHVYFELRFIEMALRIPAMFPTPEAPNQVIGVTGRGETVDFSSLITDVIPNLHLVASAQWFP